MFSVQQIDNDPDNVIKQLKLFEKQCKDHQQAKHILLESPTFEEKLENIRKLTNQRLLENKGNTEQCRIKSLLNAIEQLLQEP